MPNTNQIARYIHAGGSRFEKVRRYCETPILRPAGVDRLPGGAAGVIARLRDQDPEGFESRPFLDVADDALLQLQEACLLARLQQWAAPGPLHANVLPCLPRPEVFSVDGRAGREESAR